MNKKLYLTLSEAIRATALLDIHSKNEYQKRYRENPKLPSNPNQFYSDDWPIENGWNIFLGKVIKSFYPTLAEAKTATALLGINSYLEYIRRYKEDLQLPRDPKEIYFEEWPTKNGWKYFLGTVVKDFYPTLIEAKEATALLAVSTRNEYRQRYKDDPKLPSSPYKVYFEEWPIKNGWACFLGKERKEPYPTLLEAKKATLILKITSRTEYKKRYKEDPKLTSNPNRTYPDEWPHKNGWSLFFGLKLRDIYLTFSEAKIATATLNITSRTEYRKRYKEDPKLPSNPNQLYSDDWPIENGWCLFLGKVLKDLYPTLTEAKKAIISLGITSRTEYRKRYKQDPRLPSTPDTFYSKEWPSSKGWSLYLIEASYTFYSTLDEAKSAVIVLGITSSKEYKERYKEDPRLPSSPNIFYSNDWSNLNSSRDFFIPKIIYNFTLLVQAIKALNIKNSKEYRALRKEFNQLPSNPKRSFPKDFIDWFHLCDIPKPYSYSKLQRLVKKKKITTIAGYKKWRTASEDPCIPSNPHESSFYKCHWINWFTFFGVEEPYQPNYLYEPYLAWRDVINEFMRFARGGGTKKTLLCKFVRLYIQKYQLGETPIDFIFNKEINVANFRDFLTQESYPSKIYNAADEFLDYIIREKCSDEDPETGEITRAVGAKNRIKGIWLPEAKSGFIPDETVKPALPYQYVQAIRDWTFPSHAKTFSDLTHLHKFDADWVKVPIGQIEKNDPDCVFEIIDNNFAKIWIPIYWMHAYSIFSVPLRGIQIAYNDSGEADTYIPEYKNNKIVWVKNTGKLAGFTKNQGMIKRYPNDEFGMFSTSNKTSMSKGSQSVPWIPIELAYWLIKLRKWQSKYNPIDAPKAWLDCERTNINEQQRKQKGANCFLFRDFGEEECGTFGGRLANRLAVALYFTQPKGITLAKCEGKHSAISMYKSEFTPSQYES